MKKIEKNKKEKSEENNNERKKTLLMIKSKDYKWFFCRKTLIIGDLFGKCSLYFQDN